MDMLRYKDLRTDVFVRTATHQTLAELLSDIRGPLYAKISSLVSIVHSERYDDARATSPDSVRRQLRWRLLGRTHWADLYLQKARSGAISLRADLASYDVESPGLPAQPVNGRLGYLLTKTMRGNMYYRSRNLFLDTLDKALSDVASRLHDLHHLADRVHFSEQHLRDALAVNVAECGIPQDFRYMCHADVIRLHAYADVLGMPRQAAYRGVLSLPDPEV